MLSQKVNASFLMHHFKVFQGLQGLKSFFLKEDSWCNGCTVISENSCYNNNNNNNNNNKNHLTILLNNTEFLILSHRPLSHSGHFESQENKKLCFCPSSLALDERSDPIFKSLKLLKFENIVSLQVAKIMYLYKSGQLPDSFQNMFFTGQEIHNYNTRNRSFFRLPSCRTNVRKFSLRFQGPKIFNSINDEIKNSLSLREFTSKLKSTFLD